jgi:hypothetical protein
MRLCAATGDQIHPILLSPRGLGGRLVRQLRLHSDERGTRPASRNRSPGPVGRIDQAAPSRPGDRSRHPAEDAVDRLDRQLRNLRELLGESFNTPDGPRAA